MVVLCLGGEHLAYAQADTSVVSRTDSTGVEWSVYVDGSDLEWGLPDRPLDEFDAVLEGVVGTLRRQGFPFAVLDSVRADTVDAHGRVTFYLKRGAGVEVGHLAISGSRVFTESGLLGRMETRPGRAFSPARLEDDIARLLGDYERRGYLLAEIRVAGVQVSEGDAPKADVTLTVDEGPRSVLRQVVLRGDDRTRSEYAARIAGLRLGDTLRAYDPERVRQRLIESGEFREVGRPELRVLPDSAAVLVIPVQAASPGQFDLVLGYQPSSGSGKLVGSGHLELNNLLGAGLGASLRLNRLPGQVSTVHAAFSDPLLPVVPLGIRLLFDGTQDSTFYGKQRYEGALTYRFSGGMEARASVSRERTRPGEAGVDVLAGRQRVPRSDAVFMGVGLRYERVDVVENPRKGFVFDVSFERGRKDRSLRMVSASGDTTMERNRQAQARFTGTARLFLPTLRRQVFVVGVDGRLLESDVYDPSDLFRFGGANTLRGYDEDRFRGRLVARGLLEYRYQVDPASFAFTFLDIGYVETPVSTEQRIDRGVYPGFGFGLQFETAVGIVNTSYAMNREGGRLSGRVHIGLSFGL
ncbi:MAG TPA: POTRA domain-containing protein [Rhodothermales bacterium]|nr:POTRA domain-containing protein [Rhodothermales bacterium]